MARGIVAHDIYRVHDDVVVLIPIRNNHNFNMLEIQTDEKALI